jgi:hypothetical protein
VINLARAKKEPAMKTKLAVLLLCCIIGSGLQAQTLSPFPRLKAVDIVVEDLSTDAEKVWLTKGDLESVALVALKSKLPKVDVRKAAISYVYINVTLVCTEYVCAANADISLNRPTTVLEDDRKAEVGFLMANVWHVNTLFISSRDNMAHRVKEYIDEAITSFAAEWYKANP